MVGCGVLLAVLCAVFAFVPPRLDPAIILADWRRRRRIAGSPIVARGRK